MSQYEYQRLLDGGVEVLQSKSIVNLFDEIEIDSDAENSERVRHAVLNHPETQKFIVFGIPSASDKQQAHEAFTEWLYAIPSFEAWARTARKYAGTGEFAGREKASIPGWYVAYLSTEYWQRKRAEVLDTYKGCVLCGTSSGKIDTHHRTYATLGRERMWDLSLLCDSCHFRVHRFLSVCFPSECPDEVRVIIEREVSFVHRKMPQEATP
jgi:hypothetical protein